jgi:hypothetical protein
VKQVVRHRECRNRDRKNPEGKSERSALTVVEFRGLERPMLDH